MVPPIIAINHDVDLVNSLVDVDSNGNSNGEEEDLGDFVDIFEIINDEEPILVVRLTIAIDPDMGQADSLKDVNNDEPVCSTIATDPNNKPFNGLMNNTIWCWSILLTSWLNILAIS